MNVFSIPVSNAKAPKFHRVLPFCLLLTLQLHTEINWWKCSLTTELLSCCTTVKVKGGSLLNMQLLLHSLKSYEPISSTLYFRATLPQRILKCFQMTESSGAPCLHHRAHKLQASWQKKNTPLTVQKVFFPSTLTNVCLPGCQDSSTDFSTTMTLQALPE